MDKAHQQHPVTPPEDVIEALRSQAPQCDVDAGVNKVRETQLVIAAYRAGADHELEEILLYPGDEPEDCRYFDWVLAANIRAWRRPKPPSLAEQGQRILMENGRTMDGRVEIGPEGVVTIRAALERLQQLEARRLQPSGLAVQALGALGQEPFPEADPTGDTILNAGAIRQHRLVRRALERLQELENNG